MKKVLLILVIALVAIIGGLLSYVKLLLPDVGPAPDIQVEITPARLKRGEYLANAVCVCMDCHSKRDWTKFSGPPVEGTFGQGGEVFNQDFGFPGSFISKNITPAGIKDWSDGEIFRTITTGVNKYGKALFPIMPYMHYGQMDQEDLYSIIAYIRSLRPIEKANEESKPDFPMNFILNTIPSKQEMTKLPSPADKLAYGKYMWNASGCTECHTKQEKGKQVPGMEMAGGFEFNLGPMGIVRSTNLTPDVETGIGSWTEQNFLDRFHVYSDSAYVPHTVEKGAMQTVMPWVMYAKMTDEDLSAIFAYLKTLPPVKNQVEKFTAR
ncbi:MAG TPA: c-type cytochrome [Bacteroidia bacterium]|nr:c-type cytochrome [Bacteroidia bacterium]HRH09655.1 c-type cytochrome [Bacteroidia bacterium]HRH62054.1 c-type cytochrome [Bacteroidia bacterium]